MKWSFFQCEILICECEKCKILYTNYNIVNYIMKTVIKLFYYSTEWISFTSKLTKIKNIEKIRKKNTKVMYCTVTYIILRSIFFIEKVCNSLFHAIFLLLYFLQKFVYSLFVLLPSSAERESYILVFRDNAMCLQFRSIVDKQ